MTIITMLMSTTHVDLQGDKFTRGALESAAEQIRLASTIRIVR